jgi:hypothetical protein
VGEGDIVLERLVVLGTMEYLASIRHHVTIPPCVFGTVEGGVRGAQEIFFAGDVGRAGTDDTQADSHGDHFVLVDTPWIVIPHVFAYI